MNPKRVHRCLILLSLLHGKVKIVKKIYLISAVVMTALVIACLAYAGSGLGSQNPTINEKPGGVYFEIELSSTGAAPIEWKNWRDSGKYRGESEMDGNSSVTIVAGGYSYSLSPSIKVARKSKLVLDEKKNPLAGKYGPLADIPQIDPLNYLSTIRRLGAQQQGAAELNGKKADLYMLKIADASSFPWNNFMFWFDKTTTLPLQIQYQEGSKIHTIKFLKIDKNAKIDADKFTVPPDYKLIEFEWD